MDLHYGYERRAGHKVPLHDIKAWNSVLGFAADFKPDFFILGGDILDCAAISHHNKNKPGKTEGLKLADDAEECWKKVIKPIESLKPSKLIYLTGNHEDWLNDLIDDMPTLEGVVKLDKLLHLNKWTVIEQGRAFHLGKLTFVHGDQLKGGEGVAKQAVIAYERSIRFGHYHTYTAYTKTSILDYKLGKTAICVPCLCHKGPMYGEGSPNKWMQGFDFGWVHEDESFTDYIPIIVNGKFTWNNKVYKG